MKLPANFKVGRVTPCAPQVAIKTSDGAHGVARPTGTARRRAGVSLIECLVYIGMASVILGVGYQALYSATENARGLRRNSDDIAAALSAGERWRQDIRDATGVIRVENLGTNQVAHIPQRLGAVTYEFAEGRLRRQAKPDGAWMVLLPKVQSSVMAADARKQVTAWRWDFMIKPASRQVRLKPVFSFAAVPGTKELP